MHPPHFTCVMGPARFHCATLLVLAASAKFRDILDVMKPLGADNINANCGRC
uniref:Uncharacterized protein n=1 Tax=Caenorhabditis japonica TaxID=281687 RepID=A0A8R1J116_CAEJA